MSAPMNPSEAYGRTQPIVTGPTVTVATFDDYPGAQRAVDFLADRGFPVGTVSIVGTDLRLVEKVLGRLTVLRATGAGALSGAWIGLLIGILLSIFTTRAWFGVILLGIALGALWGAVFGAVAHAATGGRRDFTSVSRIDAAHYAVNVATDHAEEARRLLMALT